MEAARQGLRPRTPTPSKPTKSLPSTNAERCRRYKQKIREDPSAYENFKLKKREYNKTYHTTKLLDDEAKERWREQNRKSQQKRRARLKTEAILAQVKTSTPKNQKTTRVKTREQLAKDAEKKLKATMRQRKRRANMHPQKRRRENEKRMDRYYHQKAAASSNSGPSATQKISLASLLKGAYHSLKQGREKLTLFKLQFIKKLMERNPSAAQLRTADFYHRHRPTYPTVVETFLERNAVDFPGQRGSSTPKKILTKTMADLFIDFKKTYNDKNISFTTFKRKRPPHLLLTRSRKFIQCLCERCTNAMLIMEAVNPYLKKKDSGNVCEKITNVDDLVRKTLCTNVTRACINRDCESCGVDELIRGFRRELGENVHVEKEWKRWEKSEKSNKDLVSRRSTLNNILDHLSIDLISLGKHLKIAHWQRKQYQWLCSNMPPGHAVLTVDFAENYLCKFQNEVQSAHWSYRQVSVHPCVFHYKCDKPGCHKVLIDYLVFLSDDLRHDSSFTKTVFENCISYAEDKGISCLHIYSDGCASQYKSRYAFNHLNELQEKFESVKITRHFFGSNHGKSLCDSCGGTVKNAATRAVLSGEHFIQSAQEMHDFCVNKLSFVPDEDCSHLKNRRSFVLLKNIVRIPSAFLKAIPGTQEIHCLCPLKEGSLMVKHLSCFCDVCLIGEGSNCSQKDFTLDWTCVSLYDKNKSKKSKKISKNKTKIIEIEAHEGEGSQELTNSEENECNEIRCSSPELSLPVSREEFFSSVQRMFTSCKDFQMLQQAAEQLSPSFLNYPLPTIVPRCVIQVGQAKVDAIAHKLTPPGLNLYPLLIIGDGNCVARSLSIFCFGDEDHHREIRCRLACELAMNGPDYLSLEPSVLNFLCQQADTLCHDAWTTFQVETLNICKDGIFMGIWQLMAAANVLEANIVSFYPKMGPQKYRDFYTRVLKPRSASCPHMLTLLWSATQEHAEAMPTQYWTANHVVPLMSLDKEIEVTVDLNSFNQ